MIFKGVKKYPLNDPVRPRGRHGSHCSGEHGAVADAPVAPPQTQAQRGFDHGCKRPCVDAAVVDASGHAPCRAAAQADQYGHAQSAMLVTMTMLVTRARQVTDSSQGWVLNATNQHRVRCAAHVSHVCSTRPSQRSKETETAGWPGKKMVASAESTHSFGARGLPTLNANMKRWSVSTYVPFDLHFWGGRASEYSYSITDG